MSAGANAGQLLAELNENWRLMGKELSGGVLRACSMTLIVVAGPGEDPQLLGETLAAIMHDHPNRTIVLTVDGSRQVEARTSIQCWMPFGKQTQVCCEQILVSAPRAALEEVPPVLLGLMVADLPVAVWCRDVALATLPELAPVLRLAGRIIVDTSRTPAESALPGLRALAAGPARVADLAWARITRWRERIARELTDCRAAAPGQVAYFGTGEPMAARYLAAWLRQAAGVTIALRCEDSSMPGPGMGRIHAVRLAGLEMRRVAPSLVVTSCGQACSSALFPQFSDADLLHEELSVFGRDLRFEAVLAEVMAAGEAA